MLRLISATYPSGTQPRRTTPVASRHPYYCCNNVGAKKAARSVVSQGAQHTAVLLGLQSRSLPSCTSPLSFSGHTGPTSSSTYRPRGTALHADFSLSTRRFFHISLSDMLARRARGVFSCRRIHLGPQGVKICPWGYQYVAWRQCTTLESQGSVSVDRHVLARQKPWATVLLSSSC